MMTISFHCPSDRTTSAGMPTRYSAGNTWSWKGTRTINHSNPPTGWRRTKRMMATAMTPPMALTSNAGMPRTTRATNTVAHHGHRGWMRR